VGAKAKPRRILLAVPLVAIGSCALGILGARYVVFGRELAHLVLGARGETTELAHDFAAGTTRQLTLHATRWSSDGCRRMVVRIQLKRGGTVRSTHEDTGFDLEEDSIAWGSVSTVTTVDVPAGGYDAIAVRWTVEPSTCRFESEGLVLQIREPRF
jgi:hypothetical protein